MPSELKLTPKGSVTLGLPDASYQLLHPRETTMEFRAAALASLAPPVLSHIRDSARKNHRDAINYFLCEGEVVGVTFDDLFPDVLQ